MEVLGDIRIEVCSYFNVFIELYKNGNQCVRAKLYEKELLKGINMNMLNYIM